MNELWVKFYSVAYWGEAVLWEQLLTGVQNILGIRLKVLDVEDPPRRKAVGLLENASYIANFEGENSRWLLGKFDKSRITVSIQHYMTPRISESDFPNCFSLYIPEVVLNSDGGVERIRLFFQFANSLLHPFYSYAEYSGVVRERKSTHGAVNLQSELLGVFWMTFFCKEYVRYFRGDSFRMLKEAEIDDEGAMIMLASTPGECLELDRIRVEEQLGARSFVDPESSMIKLPGEFALKFTQLQN